MPLSIWGPLLFSQRNIDGLSPNRPNPRLVAEWKELQVAISPTPTRGDRRLIWVRLKGETWRKQGQIFSHMIGRLAFRINAWWVQNPNLRLHLVWLGGSCRLGAVFRSSAFPVSHHPPALLLLAIGEEFRGQERLDSVWTVRFDLRAHHMEVDNR